MFFSQSELSLEFLGIFMIKRGVSTSSTYNDRCYDSISIRLDGHAQFNFENEEVTIGRGDVLYLPKYQSYSQKTNGETVLAIHFINYSFSEKVKAEILNAENFEDIEKLAIKMYREWQDKSRGYRYKCISLFYEMLHILTVQAQKDEHYTSARNQLLTKAVNYIHSNYRNEQISISNLAYMCSVSETYFRKIFNEMHSVSPLRYIINLKLEYASQLLRSGLYSIVDISEKSGFNDEKYFSRLFKKRYGVTPSEYMKIIPEKEWK